MRYGTAVSSQTRMGRIAMAALAGGGLLVLAGPLRSEAKRIPDLFSSEDPAQVQSNEVTYDPTLPWQGSWDASELSTGLGVVPEGAECGSSDDLRARGLALTGQFVQPTDVTELWLTVGDTRAGTPADSADEAGPLLQPSHPPASAEVTIGDRCQVLALVDSPEVQKFDMDQEGATSFEILVVGIHDLDWDVAPMVQLEDVTWIRK